MESPGHKKNLVGPYNVMGAGAYRDERGEWYITQIFGAGSVETEQPICDTASAGTKVEKPTDFRFLQTSARTLCHIVKIGCTSHYWNNNVYPVCFAKSLFFSGASFTVSALPRRQALGYQQVTAAQFDKMTRGREKILALWVSPTCAKCKALAAVMTFMATTRGNR